MSEQYSNPLDHFLGDSEHFGQIKSNVHANKNSLVYTNDSYEEYMLGNKPTNGNPSDLHFINHVNIRKGAGTGSVVQTIDTDENVEDASRVSGNYSAAFGYNTTVRGEAAHIEGYSTNQYNGSDQNVTTSWTKKDFSVALGQGSHVEGVDNLAIGKGAHSEGVQNLAWNEGSHAEGKGNYAYATCSHAEGQGNTTTSSAMNSHVEGKNNTVQIECSHVEGQLNQLSSAVNVDAPSMCCHVEGAENQIVCTDSTNTIQWAHVEGRKNIVYARLAHAEGFENVVGTTDGSNGKFAHVEGTGNVVKANGAHAEGEGNIIETGGDRSHVGGYKNTIYHSRAFVHGVKNTTTAENQVLFGVCADSSNNPLFAIGNGVYTEDSTTGNVTETHSNAFSISQRKVDEQLYTDIYLNGNTNISADVSIGGNVVIGNSTDNGGATVNVYTECTFEDAVTMKGTLTIPQIDGLNGSLHITGDTHIGGFLNVTNKCNFTGRVTCTGGLTTNSFTLGDVLLTSAELQQMKDILTNDLSNKTY